ncbi:MAG: tRNA cyclic N6-threonylcarbamoyladenosine(37) synthase TcdA [Pseudomonadota bacterium]
MNEKILSPRFSGIERLYGSEGYERIQQAHIMVIGVGGVGSWAAEALARSQVAHISLVDLDDICASNTNRQVHTLTETIGQPKTFAMSQRMHSINPDGRVTVIDDFLTPENVTDIVTTDIDFVIDAIDSIKPKVALIAHCFQHNIPLISVGGAGGQKDPTQIQVSDLAKTHNDPLLAKLRYELRRHHGFPKDPHKKMRVNCVYSSEQLWYPWPDGSVKHQKPGNGQSINCDTGFGTSSMVTASFGLVAAAQALEAITKKN